MMKTIDRKGKGVIYSATGKKFIEEALVSAHSLKKHNKDINITIFVDRKEYLKNYKDLFHSIYEIKHPEYSFGDKIYALKHTPYKKSLFLDTDTIITDDISEVFKVLEVYEMAAANVSYNYYSYPHFNTGVILFSMNSSVVDFIDFWDDIFNRKKENHDQGAFQRALAKMSINFFTLPPNYNFRVRFASYVKGKIKIIHYHHLHMNSAERLKFIAYLNSSLKERVWFPRKNLIINFKEKSNIIVKFLLHLESTFLNRIQFWDFLSKRKLFHYKLISPFPWLIN